ncbi:MAG: type II toxin-antitoxin system RelE/ParE family toxin [Deltaproteobacteria bacterium]|nr:MAG: type II toxin-antitoxin system RelE/ParE family toxin [Deltaproteobacteria bacterium]TMQ11750.1 MAG: type II toxin-antitoxin system RelE/ParE family toxin [Deltaproteobacteria bacterium]
MRWKLSLQAKADLRRIGHRIARSDPRAAEAWIDKLEERVRLAGQSPGLGRKVPEIDRDDIREAIVGNYRIVYFVDAKVITILTIFEGHHLLPELDLPDGSAAGPADSRDHSRSR